MPLPDEAPFTEAEVIEVVHLVNTVLSPINTFISSLDAAVVHPDAFLQIPYRQEQLQNLIDHFSVIHDLIPRPIFEQYLGSMLSASDQLAEAETRAPPLSGGSIDSQPLFGALEREYTQNGSLRLAIPQELVESLMDDVGLTNDEIADDAQ
ncbi:hypothetical protein M407DRAFT_31160 [Tulasnella calospora MUT 4182]|uniref:Uncharacterized protein n=1 Tax=Tulasnella calospora MUT 4182 TaxID=1051891 RepID=A0A0C3LCJ5_9AGAM|nr:hypothetical protein M407DRAFT_31160 [Tulasnella calospora MUT 4182]